MKTIDPHNLTVVDTTTQDHPEIGSAPPRTGVLGTILVDLEFGEEERNALRDLADWLAPDLDEIVGVAAIRARDLAIATESVTADPISRAPAVRPSIRNLRKHAARQWIHATLAGVYDSAFSRQLRHTWMPILLAEQYQNRATPALVDAFLTYFEAFVTARIVDTVADNLVPFYRMLHGFRTALNVQRRMFGLTEIA